MEPWFWVVSVIVILLDIVIAVQFGKIAEMKGYHTDSSKYTWFCVLFGIAGWMMVIALPDKSQNNTAVSDQLPNL